jgi:hypothetical protein
MCPCRNMVCEWGIFLLISHSLESLTKVFYLSFYAPVMYWCFLREFFQKVGYRKSKMELITHRTFMTNLQLKCIMVMNNHEFRMNCCLYFPLYNYPIIYFTKNPFISQSLTSSLFTSKTQCTPPLSNGKIPKSTKTKGTKGIY